MTTHHWTAGLSLSTAGAALAGAGFSLVTGYPGWGAAGVVLAAGVVTTWLSSPREGLGVTIAAWLALFALMWAIGLADAVAGLVVWVLLIAGLAVGVGRAWREAR